MSGVDIRQKAAFKGVTGKCKKGGPPLCIGLAGALIILHENVAAVATLFCLRKNKRQLLG